VRPWVQQLPHLLLVRPVEDLLGETVKCADTTRRIDLAINIGKPVHCRIFARNIACVQYRKLDFELCDLMRYRRHPGPGAALHGSRRSGPTARGEPRRHAGARRRGPEAARRHVTRPGTRARRAWRCRDQRGEYPVRRGAEDSDGGVSPTHRGRARSARRSRASRTSWSRSGPAGRLL
jgi:hypothetical protein